MVNGSDDVLYPVSKLFLLIGLWLHNKNYTMMSSTVTPPFWTLLPLLTNIFRRFNLEISHLVILLYFGVKKTRFVTMLNCKK